MTIRSTFAILVVLSTAPAFAQDVTHAFVGAHIEPIDGPPIERGTLLVKGGKIVAVGPVADVRVPDDAVVVDAAGRTILPGLVDTHSHIGSVAGADGSGPKIGRA